MAHLTHSHSPPYQILTPDHPCSCHQYHIHSQLVFPPLISHLILLLIFFLACSQSLGRGRMRAGQLSALNTVPSLFLRGRAFPLDSPPPHPEFLPFACCHSSDISITLANHSHPPSLHHLIHQLNYSFTFPLCPFHSLKLAGKYC